MNVDVRILACIFALIGVFAGTSNSAATLTIITFGVILGVVASTLIAKSPGGTSGQTGVFGILAVAMAVPMWVVWAFTEASK